MLGPVQILEQRRDFLEGIMEVAIDCNWSDPDITELKEYLWDSLVETDNLMLDTYAETRDPRLSRKIWEAKMEDLRHWLGTIFGVKIKYI